MPPKKKKIAVEAGSAAAPEAKKAAPRRSITRKATASKAPAKRAAPRISRPSGKRVKKVELGGVMITPLEKTLPPLEEALPPKTPIAPKRTSPEAKMSRPEPRGGTLARKLIKDNPKALEPPPWALKQSRASPGGPVDVVMAAAAKVIGRGRALFEMLRPGHD